MSNAEQVIPYAEVAKPRAGLWLGTILAMYAIACSCVELANNVGLANTLARITNNPAPTAAIIVLQWLYVGSMVCQLIGAALLLLTRSIGALVVGMVGVMQVVLLTPLLLSLIWSAQAMRKVPSAELAGTAAGFVLSWIAAAAWVWFVCRVATEARKSRGADGANWSAIHRDCAWTLLVYGTCYALTAVIPVVVLGVHGRGARSVWNASLALAGTLLVIGGAGTAFRRPWASWFCVVAAVVWAIHLPVANIAGNAQLATLWPLLRSIDMRWLANSLSDAPKSVLLIMVLCHPQVTTRWTSSSM